MVKSKQIMAGFSLIEIMIVVGIIAIIAVIAVPSYTSYVERSKCTDAQADLLQLAQWMERRYAANFTYENAAGDMPALPDDLLPDAGTASFTITVEGDATSFTLTATPIAGRIRAAGGACGTLTLDNQGTQVGWI